ncbi:chemotaxis response regulator protein-glutamate methylesterase [Aestuariibacter halophilus]|uniref:Protein-glutamate methylesterase/protein-glutamine glutaminase n=1 Tax=Fluctibacter halophilus TaxID=226011 RepID=A0ABS8G683_9ALTE|nr:chemotaxis response regulator protein-glutamate methylesterase [Aestuariibacter halophilus]MCC2616028.1 chemotaxis response regulator protein-glutamate methylesterase [Aestuariibacter halophilus]
MSKVYRVVIVDDSKLIQTVLRDLLDSHPQLTVVGIAEDPHEARDVIKQTEPDVITLDVEMPRMNGITFLRNLMRLRPTPVVMISTLTSAGSGVTLQALELGAVDFVEKPHDLDRNIDHYREVITEKVLQAARVSGATLSAVQQRLSAQPAASTPVVSPPSEKPVRQTLARKICAIGGSTGGLEAVTSMLKGVRFSGVEALLITLHLPAGFTASFANRLNGLLPITVKEATDGEKVYQGMAYVAPGGRHMEVLRKPGGLEIHIQDDPPVSRHRPSVDVLFDSVSRACGKQAAGIILTGMGKDGAAGLLTMRENRALTYAQDEATSVVWGMPGSAVKMGAVPPEHVQPLLQLSRALEHFFVSSH